MKYPNNAMAPNVPAVTKKVDAMDDAVLMGGTQTQIKQTLLDMIDQLNSQYPEQKP